ncbi:MAG: hypothetical protein R3242_01090 [Akkermansiaceae bacterium]|nr:hypothetical protein [Akkermansiaceae bacterium]
MIKDSGRYAWWISGENQKARLAQPHEPRSSDVVGLYEMNQSHSIADPLAFGLPSLLTQDEPHNPADGTATPAGKTFSRLSMSLIEENNAVQPDKKFHDFSSSSTGLLTNVATGGWRKDLSILTENWDDIYSSYPGGRLPLFRYTPDAGATSQVPKPTLTNYSPDQSVLYPWSDYSQFSPQKWPNTIYAASASWQSLVNFVTAYKGLSYNSGTAESPFVWAPGIKLRWNGSEKDATNQEFYDYIHAPRLHPVLARFQFIIYLRAFPDPNREGKYGLEMVWSPVVTLWNPYNVRLTIDNPGPPNYGVVVGGQRSFPAAFAAEPSAWYPGGPNTIPLERYRMLTNGNFQYADTNGNFGAFGGRDIQLQANMNKGYMLRGNGEVAFWKDLRTWGVNLPKGELSFEPGEVRMFSANGNSEGLFGGAAWDTNSGYQPQAPAGIPVQIRPGNQNPANFYWFCLKNDVHTQPFRFRSPGRGFHVAMGLNTGDSYTGGSLYNGISQEMVSFTALTNGDRAQVYWPDNLEPHGYTIGEIASVPAMPIYSITIGPRFTIGAGPGTAENRPTKGYVQNDPFAGMSLVDPGTDNANSHPANGNMEVAYHTLSYGSSLTPNLSDREGFAVTGFQSGDGLSRLITHQVPLRPMASLIELQAWNPRGKNPMPPYQSHLIGNSDATPMIPSDDIVPPTMNPNNVAENLQHDDAYCANHLLFDDWFLSSIAPQPASIGGTSGTDIETTYENFLRGDSKLSNRSYRAIPEDRGLSDEDITNLVDLIVNSPDGWLKSASRLEVEGMFNINSTSVDAWKAILGHARGIDKIAIHESNGLEELNHGGEHPVTRGAVATDVEAGSNQAIGGDIANASEFTGFRKLTDDQIEDLANKIVEQVRLRGPFLSLGEFVNRQLSNNNELAISGAVQSAISDMEDDPMSVLRNPGNFLAADTMAPSDPKLNGVGYQFSEAAQGSSAHGVNGWIRQADVLRPIAPILTARDDTFTIRAYGDATDSSGKVVARAWCEAVVKRTRNFCHEADEPDTIEPPTNASNQIFGRQYEVVSFRWLNSREV